MNMQSYPLGLAIKNAGGRKTKQNRHIRSARQRRKAFEKQRDALIEVAWKRWGAIDNMPLEAQAELDMKINQLRLRCLGC